MISNLDSIKEMGLIARNLLIKGDIQQYGLLMHDHWMQKVKGAQIFVQIIFIWESKSSIKYIHYANSSFMWRKRNKIKRGE